MTDKFRRPHDWRPLPSPVLPGRWIAVARHNVGWRILLVEDDFSYLVHDLPFGSRALALRYADAFAGQYGAARLEGVWEV